MSATTSLEPAALDVAAGGSGTARLRIRNSGAIVDRFDVSPVGPAAAWIAVEPASSSLFPGQEATVTVRFSPPRSSSLPAGPRPFGLRVVPAANPAGSSVEEGRVTVLPFAEAAAEIVPQNSRGTRVGRHEVHVTNHGNAPAEIAVTASDPDRLLAFTVTPERVTLGPGERTAVHVEAAARDTFLRGPRRSIPFTVEVRAGAAPPVLLRATFSQGGVVPGWLAPVAGVAAAAVVAAIVLPGLVFPPPPGGEDPSATPPGPTASVPGESPSDGAPTPDVTDPGEPTPATPTDPPVATAPPAPTAPSAQIRLRFQLEDLLYRGGEVGQDKVNPVFTFDTFGPGPVQVTLREVIGDQDGGVTICLGASGAAPTCETLQSAGFVTVQNDDTGTRAWEVTARPAVDGTAPQVDLVFAFHALRPEFTLADNGTFEDSYSYYTVVVTAGEQSELRMEMTFSAAASWWWYGPRDLDTFGAPPPLQRGGPAFSWFPNPVNLANGRSYEIRFEGEGRQDSNPIDYTWILKW